MQLKSVIIDDEQNNIDNLTALLLKHCPQVTVVDDAKSAKIGKEIILQHQPDLVFLDIQMPGGSGFDLLQSLQHWSFEVVFVTAYDQYGIQAIRFAALDYLLKPVNTEDLKQAVARAAERSVNKKQNLQLENLIQLLQEKQQKEEHRLALPTLKETRFVYVKDIVQCVSSNNYTSFYLGNTEKILVSKPIYEYEEMLASYGFIRCHQSYLVNKRFVKSWVKGDGGYLLLMDGTQVPVSRNKRELVKEALDG